MIKYVYLRKHPKAWAIHLAKASDTMGFVVQHCASTKTYFITWVIRPQCHQPCDSLSGAWLVWTTSLTEPSSYNHLPYLNVRSGGCEFPASPPSPPSPPPPRCSRPSTNPTLKRHSWEKWQALEASNRLCLLRTWLPCHALSVLPIPTNFCVCEQCVQEVLI